MKRFTGPRLTALFIVLLTLSSWVNAQTEIFKDNADRASYSIGYLSGKGIDDIYENVCNKLEKRYKLTIERAWFLAGFQDAVLKTSQVSDKKMKESFKALSDSSNQQQVKRAVYNIGFLAGREFRAALYKGDYDRSQLQFMESIGYKINWDKVISGALDYANQIPKLSNEEMARSKELFEQDIKKQAVLETVKTRDSFEQKAGVVKTQSGLLYRIDRLGTGNIIKNDDIIVVKYSGRLPDGSELDSSYLPTIFQLDSRPAQWVEGLKLIKKGGKITLVAMPEIQNSNDEMTLFEGMVELSIEIIDINPLQVNQKSSE